MDENATLREALVRDLNERTRLRCITSGAVLLATLGLSVAIATPKNTFKAGEKSNSGWHSSGTHSTTGGASPSPLRDCLAWGTTSSGSDLGST
jgi:hypothetical protein